MLKTTMADKAPTIEPADKVMLYLITALILMGIGIYTFIERLLGL